MWHRQHRRVDVARSWQFAREQYASLTAERDELKRELAQTQDELALAWQRVQDLRGMIDEMLATRRACELADAEVRRLYRLRDIQRARLVRRDPAQPLH
jgi:hypothetical protein